MLIRCNRGCTLQNGTTTGSVDQDVNKVVCNYCGEYVDGISDFAIKSMVSQGKVLKKEGTKSFQFKCVTCDKIVETALVDGEVRGKSCQGDCSFNISSFAIEAMKSVNKVGDNDEY